MDEIFSIRRCWLLLGILPSLAGCPDSATTSTKPPLANTGNSVSAPSAEQVVDQAIAALGGRDALQILRRGYVKMIVVGELPGISDKFATDTVTFEAHFDLPDFERRDIYSDLDGEHLLIISNSGRLWMGNQNGIGRHAPAPPSNVYTGPLTVRILQSLIDIRDSASRLVLARADSDGDVVEAAVDESTTSRITFDRKSHVPILIEKMMVRVKSDRIGGPAATATRLSKYQDFGSARLPTDVVVEQNGKRIFQIVLSVADFDNPVSAEHFEIPEK